MRIGLLSIRTALSCLLLGSAALAPVEAQQYVISTVVGEAPLPPPTPVRGVDLPIGGWVSYIAADASGNAYFAVGAIVFKLDQNGIVTRIAGTSRAGYSGDGGPATNAQLNGPAGLAVDGKGNLFFVDNGRVRRVAPSGVITTVAGNGTSGYSGDGGPAVNAQFVNAEALAVDSAGNLFVSDGNNSIRRVDSSGIITTVAGNGTDGFSGDGGPATSARLSSPTGLAVDSAGNLYIADFNNLRVRKVSPGGTITTVAGSGGWGFSGDGGPATEAKFSNPQAVAVDSVGNLYIADCEYDSGNARIRRVSLSGIITTVAGNGIPGFSGDGGPATSAQLDGTEAVAVDADGNIFIADSYNLRVRKVSPRGIITTVAGPGNQSSSGSSGDGGPATNAQLNGPEGVAVDRAGNLFIADTGNSRVRKVSPSGIITTVAGNGIRGNSGDGGPATSAQLNGPTGVAVDVAGDLFIADLASVRKVSASGIITTVASVGGYGVTLDSAGNLFIAAGYSVRKVSPDGIITTVAGGGKDIGDGGPATSVQLNQAAGVALDSAGNLFISEVYGYRVRKVSPDGIITTVAGNGLPGFSGDGGPATSAQLNAPDGLATDGTGNLYIADVWNGRIRKVSPAGIITTVRPLVGYSRAYGLTVDSAGNIYASDKFESAVRVLRPSNTSVVTSAVVDAASERADSISPGKIVVIYGAGLGPAQLILNQASNGQFGTAVGGTVVSFNGIAAPILYASATAVAVIVPYAISGTTAQVIVTYQGEASAAFAVPVALSAPSLFTSNETGSGQATAINTVDGTVNSAANPVKIGDSILLYATGEGQTSPGGVDGKLGGPAATHPVLPLSVTIGGIKADQSAGGAPGQVAGLMLVNVQIPNGVQPGGYVPVVLQVGDASTTPGGVWIAVSGN